MKREIRNRRFGLLLLIVIIAGFAVRTHMMNTKAETNLSNKCYLSIEHISKDPKDYNLYLILSYANKVEPNMNASDFKKFREQIVELSYNNDTINSIVKYNLYDEIDNIKKHLGKVNLVTNPGGDYTITNREDINSEYLKDEITKVLIKVEEKVK